MDRRHRYRLLLITIVELLVQHLCHFLHALVLVHLRHLLHPVLLRFRESVRHFYPLGRRRTHRPHFTVRRDWMLGFPVSCGRWMEWALRGCHRTVGVLHSGIYGSWHLLWTNCHLTTSPWDLSDLLLIGAHLGHSLGSRNQRLGRDNVKRNELALRS